MTRQHNRRTAAEWASNCVACHLQLAVTAASAPAAAAADGTEAVALEFCTLTPEGAAGPVGGECPASSVLLEGVVTSQTWIPPVSSPIAR